jgi:hypothetical protein
MLESGLSGSVRGVPSNGHPYRDPRPYTDAECASQHRKPCRPVSRSRGGFDGDGCQGATFTSRRGPGQQDNLAAKSAGIDALVHIVRSRERHAVDALNSSGCVNRRSVMLYQAA